MTSGRAKLVLVGDDRQLPELEAGGAFRALARKPHAIHLRENRRQVNEWEREALDHLRFGRVDEALELYDCHGRITVAHREADARDRLVDDWWNGGTDGRLMIASRRIDVEDLNRRARERMRAADRLAEDEVDVLGTRFAVGDRLVIRRNDGALGINNGDQARVVGVDSGRLRLAVELDRGGKRVELGPRFLLRRTEHGHRPVSHGYAVAAHVAQGMTVDRAYVLADPGISREWAYAALTRGRRENRIYIAERAVAERAEFAPETPAELVPSARQQLARSLARSEAQPLALERTLGRGISR